MALTKIESIFRNAVYAEMYDKVELISEHGEVLICRNVRTGDTFPARKELIGKANDADVISLVATQEKKKTNTVPQKKKSHGTAPVSKQSELF